jgi:hypothetical protein
MLDVVVETALKARVSNRWLAMFAMVIFKSIMDEPVSSRTSARAHRPWVGVTSRGLRNNRKAGDDVTLTILQGSNDRQLTVKSINRA